MFAQNSGVAATIAADDPRTALGVNVKLSPRNPKLPVEVRAVSRVASFNRRRQWRSRVGGSDGTQTTPSFFSTVSARKVRYVIL